MYFIAAPNSHLLQVSHRIIPSPYWVPERCLQPLGDGQLEQVPGQTMEKGSWSNYYWFLIFYA
tara:strand:- start:824 stop:1012 length:189 start_codon:yes stop_codon:yes gene_type:complete